MTLLQVEDLSKHFTDSINFFGTSYFTAVHKISFSLDKKKTLAIIGKNGSGKSTLAKMIVGIIPPTSGCILFNNQPLEFGDYHYRAKHIRMVFQDPNTAFNPRLNVGQILDAPLRLTTHLDEQDRNEKIFNTLKLVGLYPDHANVKIKTMSASQKQRVALARALILEPEVIIADDALGSLDATVKTQLTNLMLDLQEKLSISYIYVGQHLGIIKHIADDVLVMDEGKMIEYGPTQTLFTSPQTEVTKRLVESHFGKLLDNRSWVIK
ncbi:ATP-binding cassette domain-containing protein [Pasteurella canis]|uniref:Peptide transport system ATP-binding protein SapF n=1 Tax=Pasteurella canis TaxID=753 RepID=A0ABQ4VEW2_9PAST|nr:ATP-binding cassette domain-containing protein [Pasteurella canis]UAY78080.1 ATP-binding cassette domain-containing protein [Pasteurella canis]UEC23601.1 ATP-binding cassette domain-containing protein [Pasteurella canis]SPY33476.1 peptide transport system ATP-binding protein SapF [Pasteurella canis]GJH42537.1 peptide transport system ATP-binding protein SapF [Pasteurella canis]GJJ80548.1 peptide transport system ATP-binding protein SapF [Pasteurella canis]